MANGGESATPNPRPQADRAGWLRAAVLGADDGIVSTAAIVLGVAASDASPRSVLIAGLAGLVAGAASMAAGEYVSVSSQRDIEESLRRREEELALSHPNVALTELAVTLQLHGIDPGLARKVAQQITAAEPIGASVRVKYGITEALSAKPLQAALASALSFAVGSSIPLLGMLAPPRRAGSPGAWDWRSWRSWAAASWRGVRPARRGPERRSASCWAAASPWPCPFSSAAW